jgi:hypothetical protein
MSGRGLRAATAIVRAWTRLYTAGLPAAVRDRRRAEIDSDIWEFTQQPGAGLHLLLRAMLGAFDDLAWRDASVRRPWLHRAAAAGLAATLFVAGVFVTLARPAPLPAPAPLNQHARAVPPPPPPPPPPPRPCGSASSGRSLSSRCGP